MNTSGGRHNIEYLTLILFSTSGIRRLQFVKNSYLHMFLASKSQSEKRDSTISDSKNKTDCQ